MDVFNRNCLVLISLVIIWQLYLIDRLIYAEVENMYKSFWEKVTFSPEVSEKTSVTLSVCPYDKKDLELMADSVTRAMDFYEKHLGNLVMDAAIGTSIMEAQMKLVQAGHQGLPQYLQLRFMALQLKSEFLSKRITQPLTNKLMAKDATEKERKKVQQEFTWINATLWETPELKSWPGKDNDLLGKSPGLSVTTADDLLTVDESMTESVSDACINQIFDHCNPTEDCVQLFMEKPHSRYSLTHQVLFYLIAKQQNCFNDAQFKRKTANTMEPKEFLRIMCDKIWEEANVIQTSGYPLAFQDLLAEQILVCSLAGFEQFLKHEWLEKILSWQGEKGSSGCFLSIRNSMGESENKGFEMDQLMFGRKHGKMFQYNLRRKKRSDNLIMDGDDNCSVHFTAVSIGALAMHLRFFADTCLRNY